MKLSHRIFLGYFLIVAIAGLFLLKSVRDELRPAVRQSMEETLVDTANLLAEIVEQEVRQNRISNSDFTEAMEDFLSRQLDARIWGLTKKKPTYRIYITDKEGIVIYDSDNGKDEGKDYSRWNDVYLTLRGQYGARSTKSDPNDDTSSVMYVAAPIKQNGETIGVLTVSKPNVSVLPFIMLSQRNIYKAGIILLASALLMGWVFSAFIANSTRKLVNYAEAVKQGKKASLPNISEPELAQLGKAIEEMRQALEGKEYVERYVHTLTHEIKSPLSGIAGASELLAEDMEKETRSRFISNIKEDTSRIQNIVDRMLDLAKLEQQQTLHNIKPIDIAGIVKDVIESLEAQLLAKSLKCEINIEESQGIYGDPFLIRQAINNLVDNAIAFSPEKETIDIKGIRVETQYQLFIKDKGKGIPDYAKDKIFERFYSLPRPYTGKKSSGLGLSFVKEVIMLHNGEVIINSNDKGCEVVLSFKLMNP